MESCGHRRKSGWTFESLPLVTKTDYSLNPFSLPAGHKDYDPMCLRSGQRNVSRRDVLTPKTPLTILHILLAVITSGACHNDIDHSCIPFIHSLRQEGIQPLKKLAHRPLY